jgi:hypothetical protein
MVISSPLPHEGSAVLVHELRAAHTSLVALVGRRLTECVVAGLGFGAMLSRAGLLLGWAKLK